MTSVTKRHKSSGRDSELLLRYTQSRENVETGDEDDRRDGDNGNERIRLGFALLMIPSLMFMFYSNNKFNSKSNSNIDFSALAAHRIPGMGGLGGSGPRNHIPNEIRAMYDDKFRDKYERKKRDRYDRDQYYRDRYHRSRYDGNRYSRNRYRRRLDDVNDMYDDRPPFEVTPQEDSGGDDSRNDNTEDKHRAIEGTEANKNDEDPNRDVADYENKNRRDLRVDKSKNKKVEIDLEEYKDDDENAFDNEDDRAMDDLDYPYSPDHNYFSGYSGGFPGLSGLDHFHSRRDWNHDPHLDVDTEYPPWGRRKEKKAQKKKEDEGPYKVILFWSSQTLIKNGVPIGTKAFEDSKCFQKRCVVTSDQNYLPIADALIFSVDNDLSNIPSKSRVEQKWIFHGLSPPVNETNHNLSKLRNLINLKWTYARDSDIIYNVAKVESLIENSTETEGISDSELQLINAFNIWRKKKKMAVFVDDKCETSSKRETYVEQLKKHIDLDVYGKCVLKPCPNNDCLRKFEEQYLFILILEEYLCPDYVSASIYNALEHNLVPVVLGNVDYSKITPLNSVINVKNFTSPKDLADYLNSIGTDYNLYKTFFEWKKHFRICRVRDDLCQLCSLLHQKPDERLKPKVVSDINEWWVNKAKCDTWDNFIQN